MSQPSDGYQATEERHWYFKAEVPWYSDSGNRWYMEIGASIPEEFLVFADLSRGQMPRANALGLVSGAATGSLDKTTLISYYS